MTQISVIIPVYNGASTIRRALDSALAQTETDCEFIVIDDGSRDQTRTIIEDYCRKDARVILVPLDQNKGVAHARNQGLERATGTWIAFLDADDWMAPQRLENMVVAAQALGADIVFDNLKIISAQTGNHLWTTCFGEKGATLRLNAEDLFARDTPYRRFAIGYAQPLVRAQFIQEKGIRYHENYTLGEDFVFLAELFLEGAMAYALPFADYYYEHKDMAERDPSSYAHVDNKYDQVLAASDDLWNRYKDKVPVETQRMMKRRHQLFFCLSKIRRARMIRQQEGAIPALLFLVKNPVCLTFLFKMLFLRVSSFTTLLFVEMV